MIDELERIWKKVVVFVFIVCIRSGIIKGTTVKEVVVADRYAQ
jgi:hypothetical protein